MPALSSGAMSCPPSERVWIATIRPLRAAPAARSRAKSIRLSHAGAAANPSSIRTRSGPDPDRAAKLFHSIDSVDDFALAQRLERARIETGAAGKLRVLIEVHIASEETKTGADVKNLPALVEKIAALPMLEFAGLMCIPPFAENAEEARPHFKRLRELRDELAKELGRALPVLSMGMSHDFEVAIEEGATELRVGTALFGARGVVAG